MFKTWLNCDSLTPSLKEEKKKKRCLQQQDISRKEEVNNSTESNLNLSCIGYKAKPQEIYIFTIELIHPNIKNKHKSQLLLYFILKLK